MLHKAGGRAQEHRIAAEKTGRRGTGKGRKPLNVYILHPAASKKNPKRRKRKKNCDIGLGGKKKPMTISKDAKKALLNQKSNLWGEAGFDELCSFPYGEKLKRKRKTRRSRSCTG